MKKVLFICLCGGLLSSAAIAADPYEEWLTKQNQRGMEIDLIRVANEKAVIESEETDADVASILEEAEAIEAEAFDQEDAKDAS